MSKKSKGRIGGQFVPLLYDMLECPHGKRCHMRKSFSMSPSNV